MSHQTSQNASTTNASTWSLDVAHSSAEFTVRHMMIANVRGHIPIKSGTIRGTGSDITQWQVEAELDVANINTGAADRDGHLRSADFFDVEKFPTITFKSKRIKAEDETTFRVIGDLTIRGVTREVVLDAERSGEAKDPWGKTRVGIEATTTFNRKDFDLEWNVALEAGGVLVGDKVKVALQLQAVRDE